ncbi:AAA family ATPase [Candidatus Micrarchaeota archaeon]|nr:AAA family ATPase [Candidatus Micrarchaeota archaeon]
MPNVFSSLPEKREGVFANEDALKPEFIPDALPGRENELTQIALALRPLAESAGAKGRNLFVFGPPGSGKTASTRRALKDLNEYSDKAWCFYVNCWQYATRHAVFSQLAFLAEEPLPRRGLAADEVFERFAGAVRTSKKNAVVVLDEFDRLLQAGNDKLLYDLARAKELSGANFTEILISNDADLLSKLDARARSSLQPATIEFKQYSPTQLKEILLERAAAAFHENVLSKEALALCAACGAKAGGDARVALQALYDAGRNAEQRGARFVELVDAKKAVLEQEVMSASKEKRLTGLTRLEESTLSVLREAGKPLESGELYSLLEGVASERSLRECLNLLQLKKLVVLEEKGSVTGERGRTRLIKLA